MVLLDGLHDVESVWWTACWLIFSNGIHDEGNDLQKQLQDARELFPGKLTDGLRATFFMNGLGISTHCASLSKQFHKIALVLDSLRCHLLARYKVVESHENIEHIGSLSAEPTEIHQLFKDVFHRAARLHAKTRVALLRILLGPQWEDVPMVKVPVHWRPPPWRHDLFPIPTSKDGCKKRAVYR
jgi:hypothetical protein